MQNSQRQQSQISQEFSTRIFTKDHVKEIAQFQVIMAKDTQNVKLNSELVLKAVEHLTENPQFGFFLVRLHKEQPVGSLLLTIQNEQSWWIQSVFVKEQYRRQGHFKAMFKEAVQRSKDKGGHSLKLYVQNDNEKAKATYLSLGMFVNGEKFYTYDFVLGNLKLTDIKEKAQTSSFSIQPTDSSLNQKEFDNVLINQDISQNKKVQILQDKQCVGYATYFTQYSDWRYGLTYYVGSLWMSKEILEKGISSLSHALINYFAKQSPLNLGAFRYIFNENSILPFDQFSEGQVQHYDVLQIKF